MNRSWIRFLSGAILLALLTTCAGLGARQKAAQTVAVQDVTRVVLEELPMQEDAFEQMRASREEEIRLLDAVASDAAADADTKALALEQKLEIVRRMESEAQAKACLAGLGFEDARVVCGAQIVSVFLYAPNGMDETDRIRVIDAISGQIGADSSSLKIILQKK